MSQYDSQNEPEYGSTSVVPYAGTDVAVADEPGEEPGEEEQAAEHSGAAESLTTEQVTNVCLDIAARAASW